MTCAPIVAASSRRRTEKSAAAMYSTPLSRNAAMIAIPIGPQPITSAASPGAKPDLLTACSPTAIGSVSAACRGSTPSGTLSSNGTDSSILSAYPPSTVLLDMIGSNPLGDNNTGSDVTRVPGAGASVPGPASRTSALNSWPMNTSLPRSTGSPPCTGIPVISRVSRTIWSPCLAKCRSEPQIPQALTATRT